ncbi:MAG: RlpA-like double-psi beta-barrel domain-containing protein [Collinsella sp.]|nr:RlpA-like double-psi beta-barrel domain-containing protein [Collinsella sp.]
MDASPLRSRILRRTARAACAAGLAGALVLAAAPTGTAWAASAETASELAELGDEVREAADSYAGSMARAQELQSQVDDLADEIISLEQETLPAARERAGVAAVNLYKMQDGSANLLAALLSTDTLSALSDFAKYLGVIQDTYVADLDELTQVRDELSDKMAEVSAAKDEAAEEEAAAAASLARARSAQQAMEERAASEDAAEAEAARAAAAEAAAALAAAEAAHAPASTSSASDGGASGGAAGGTAEAAPSAPASDGGAASGASGEAGADAGAASGGASGGTGGSAGDSSPSAGWLTGVASYYGIGDGFMGGTTANGETVTETSMGIAMLNVPFGTRIEISYGGRSVIAYVNDRGPYAHGRVIDMQPAVARALGFLNVGVGTVRYRFL